MLGTVPFANSHRGDSGRIKYNKDKRAAGVDKTSIKCLQFRIPAHDNMPTSNPPEKVHDILRHTFLKYDSFKKDNQKNCWLRTCLWPSIFLFTKQIKN